MKFWKNLFAGDLLYQDLGDCSLCCMPVSAGIDIQLKEPVFKEKDEAESKAA